jgi:hypothetical protein
MKYCHSIEKFFNDKITFETYYFFDDILTNSAKA